MRSHAPSAILVWIETVFVGRNPSSAFAAAGRFVTATVSRMTVSRTVKRGRTHGFSDRDKPTTVRTPSMSMAVVTDMRVSTPSAVITLGWEIKRHLDRWDEHTCELQSHSFTW